MGLCTTYFTLVCLTSKRARMGASHCAERVSFEEDAVVHSSEASVADQVCAMDLCHLTTASCTVKTQARDVKRCADRSLGRMQLDEYGQPPGSLRWDTPREAAIEEPSPDGSASDLSASLVTQRSSLSETPAERFAPRALSDDGFANDESNVSGRVFLTALEGASSEDAAELVRNASSVEINATDKLGVIRTLLITAIEGHVDACRELLARNDFLGVNACDVIGSNALHFAAGNDNAEICVALLECPRFTPDVNAKNNHSRTALDFAVDFADGDAIAVLQAAGASGRGDAKRFERRSGVYNVQTGIVEMSQGDSFPFLSEASASDECDGFTSDMAELD